jgi:hypothetical protein
MKAIGSEGSLTISLTMGLKRKMTRKRMERPPKTGKLELPTLVSTEEKARQLRKREEPLQKTKISSLIELFSV